MSDRMRYLQYYFFVQYEGLGCAEKISLEGKFFVERGDTSVILVPTSPEEAAAHAQAQMAALAPWGGQLGGQMALLKVNATKNMEFCAREASQIMGGSSYVREGKGQIVERLYREVRVNAIGGGSEEVLLDLAANAALGRPARR